MTALAAKPVRTMTRPASRAPQAVRMAEMFEGKSRPWSALWSRWFRISEIRPPGDLPEYSGKPQGHGRKGPSRRTGCPPAGAFASGGLRGKGRSAACGQKTRKPYPCTACRKAPFRYYAGNASRQRRLTLVKTTKTGYGKLENTTKLSFGNKKSDYFVDKEKLL